MNKLLLIVSTLCAFCSFTYAGSEESSAKEMKQVALPSPCPNWTGFYGGVFGGYKFGAIDTNLSLGGDWDSHPGSRNIVEAHAPDNLDSSGGELGGLIGYNYQFTNRWVLGLEAAGGYLWLRDSEGSGIFHTPATGDFDITTSFKTHYLVTIGPRIGYAFCRWLPYVTGGLAIGDLELFQQIRSHDYYFQQSGSQTETNVGWMIGGGLEYAIAAHWRARMQYQYIDLGDIDVSLGSSPGGLGHFIADSGAGLREHNVSFAIIYNF